jgi:hypothetical protein
MTNIDLAKLQFTFRDKPLLIGGKAMEYYGIRETKNDIDFVISPVDHERLIKQYPDNLKDIFGDIGVIKFEIWNTIRTFDYDYLKDGAIERETYLVISVEKLFFLKTLAMYDDEKCRRDVKLIVDYVLKKAYGLPQKTTHVSLKA